MFQDFDLLARFVGLKPWPLSPRETIAVFLILLAAMRPLLRLLRNLLPWICLGAAVWLLVTEPGLAGRLSAELPRAHHLLSHLHAAIRSNSR